MASCKNSRRLATLTRQGSPTHVKPAPATLAAWKQESQGRQTGLQGAQEPGSTRNPRGTTPVQQKWAQRLGATTTRHRPRSRNPVLRHPVSPASQSNNCDQVVHDVDGSMDNSVRPKDPTRLPETWLKNRTRGLVPSPSGTWELMPKEPASRCRSLAI